MTTYLTNITFNSTRCIRNKGGFSTWAKTPADFQLHTVHQERTKGITSPRAHLSFQLHTVHQELYAMEKKLQQQQPFNSTRCIRNEHISIPISYNHIHGFQLHTVHQEHDVDEEKDCLSVILSTPHGALGTPPAWVLSDNMPSSQDCFQLHTVHQELEGLPLQDESVDSFNSTRCIRNVVPGLEASLPSWTFNSTRCIRNIQSLSKKEIPYRAFNSTRCIRNMVKEKSEMQ